MPAKLPSYWQEAKLHLSRDAVLKPIIERYPEVRLRLKKDAFTTLARAIAGQQISVKAADSIWARVVAAAKGKPAKIDPTRIYRLSVQELRACGLSERKALYLQNLAEHFIAKKISAGQLARMADAEAKSRLVELHGIGPWTAEMYLMFNLWRPDILPLGDVGLIRAIRLHYFKGRKVSLKSIRRIAAPWSPYSTVAVWYLWRSLDPYPVEY
ncbi:MAG: DNA-3-methyladenine glycosylase 2 family protein [Spirochaetes bacterium]|nr:DNA-3-methyladenine glycosylase 2 family protein [Spirochaetota bacterium]